MSKIQDYEYQQRALSMDLQVMRKSDTDLSLMKYLAYDDPLILDCLFDEIDRRERLDA